MFPVAITKFKLIDTMKWHKFKDDIKLFHDTKWTRWTHITISCPSIHISTGWSLCLRSWRQRRWFWARIAGSIHCAGITTATKSIRFRATSPYWKPRWRIKWERNRPCIYSYCFPRFWWSRHHINFDSNPKPSELRSHIFRSKMAAFQIVPRPKSSMGNESITQIDEMRSKFDFPYFNSLLVISDLSTVGSGKYEGGRGAGKNIKGRPEFQKMTLSEIEKNVERTLCCCSLIFSPLDKYGLFFSLLSFKNSCKPLTVSKLFIGLT